MIAFVNWVKNPFASESGEPSGWHLFLAIGLILVFIAAWGMIFRHIRENIG